MNPAAEKLQNLKNQNEKWACTPVALTVLVLR